MSSRKTPNVIHFLNYILAAILATACSTPKHATTEQPALVMQPLIISGIKDERPRFRQAFCAALQRDGIQGKTDCSDRLLRLSDESGPAPESHTPRLADPNIELLIVPGIFGECASKLVSTFGDAVSHMDKLGYRSSTIPIRGRASSALNAIIIRNFILEQATRNPDTRYLLITYSKGTTDAMHALSDHPEIRDRVLALISFAGVVNGTPIADSLSTLYGSTLGAIADERCPTTDHGEVSSLTRLERLNWLHKNRLPAGILYFSVIALPEPERVSAALWPIYTRLSKIDPRNDSQMIHFDSIIPGSTLLGYANADHWAIALPFETEAPELANTLINKNDFPRSQLLEAAIEVALETLQSRRNLYF